MARVAGADGTHGGWAVVFSEEDRWRIRKVAILSEDFARCCGFFRSRLVTPRRPRKHRAGALQELGIDGDDDNTDGHDGRAQGRREQSPGHAADARSIGQHGGGSGSSRIGYRREDRSLLVSLIAATLVDRRASKAVCQGRLAPPKPAERNARLT